MGPNGCFGRYSTATFITGLPTMQRNAMSHPTSDEEALYREWLRREGYELPEGIDVTTARREDLRVIEVEGM